MSSPVTPSLPRILSQPSSSSSAEKGQLRSRYITGFAFLSDAITSDDDHSAVVFKRFDKLAARNLLYLQAELAELEALQEEYDREDFNDANDHDDHQLYMQVREAARDWSTFSKRACLSSSQGGGSTHSITNVSDDRWKKRMDLAIKIRGVMKEYREALLQESQLLALRSPSKQAHKAIDSIFNNEHLESPFPTLLGASTNIYNPENRLDLVSLSRVGKEDRLTVFLRTHCSILFQRRRPPTSSPSSRPGIRYFSAWRISIVVSAITVLLASTFLFGAICHLYYVERDQVKLALIATYTIAFAATIGLISKAERGEIFSACAAYAAVLVVFVSGNLGGGAEVSKGQG